MSNLITVWFELEGSANFKWLNKAKGLSALLRQNAHMVKHFSDEHIRQLPSNYELNLIRKKIKGGDPKKHFIQKMDAQQKLQCHINDWMATLNAKSFSFE